MRSTTIENGPVPEGLEGGTRGDGKRGPNVKDTYTAHIPIVANPYENADAEAEETGTGYAKPKGKAAPIIKIFTNVFISS